MNREIREYIHYSIANLLTKQEAIDLFNSKFFTCPRCGVLYDRKIGKYGGLCCNHCITNDDLKAIEENREKIRQQLIEIQQENLLHLNNI